MPSIPFRHSSFALPYPQKELPFGRHLIQAQQKRKRKQAETGLTIADDDVDVFSKSRNNDAEDDDDDAPTFVPSGAKASNRKTSWKTVGSVAPTNSEQAAADAILADAAAESAARAQEDDDQPAVVDENGGDVDMSGPQMASGAMAGLQTAAQVTAALKKREREERKAMQEAGMDPTGKAQETIYRDASGRIINVAMKRAELRRQAEADAKKKEEEEESARGDVQRRQKEERKRELEDAKYMTVARHADDKELNAELKERERWNDPMAALMSKSSGKNGKAAKGRKLMLVRLSRTDTASSLVTDGTA
ncbi:Pre-mRNA-splicing factor cwc26 [Taxawa tesnikishii (nom. ined.)]|nr:Pre-mRNA-splicing factor cwc26 [Dothideales sp. JES 119]